MLKSNCREILKTAREKQFKTNEGLIWLTADIFHQKPWIPKGNRMLNKTKPVNQELYIYIYIYKLYYGNEGEIKASLDKQKPKMFIDTRLVLEKY